MKIKLDENKILDNTFDNVVPNLETLDTKEIVLNNMAISYLSEIYKDINKWNKIAVAISIIGACTLSGWPIAIAALATAINTGNMISTATKRAYLEKLHDTIAIATLEEKGLNDREILDIIANITEKDLVEFINNLNSKTNI